MDHPAGFCDGTANSQCHREPAYKCLASGHNDGRGYIIGDALSGWLVFRLRNVTKGIPMARVQTWSGPTPWTEGWTELNDGVSGASNRRLMKPPPPLPVDYHFEGEKRGNFLFLRGLFLLPPVHSRANTRHVDSFSSFF